MPRLIVTWREVASCPVCCCLVLAHAFPDGSLLVWDPDWGDRRMVRGLLTAEDVARQGFGLAFGATHECPPEEDCAITHWDRRREQEEDCGEGEGRAPR